MYAWHCSWIITQILYTLFPQPKFTLSYRWQVSVENHLNVSRGWGDSRLEFHRAHSAWVLTHRVCSSSMPTKNLGYLLLPILLDKVSNSYCFHNLRLLRSWLCFSEALCLAFFNIVSLKFRNSAYVFRGKLRLYLAPFFVASFSPKFLAPKILGS